jgi:hypothetical protein
MEEMKLVMQTLAGLGEAAKVGFIWWLVVDKLVPSIFLGLFGGGLVGVAFYVAKNTFAATRSSDELVRSKQSLEREREESIKTISIIRGILGVYKYPTLKSDGTHYSMDDFKVTIEAVNAVKDVARQKEDEK